MVAVVTAIVAGLLAGAVALYRERRGELARFLVAARVVRALLIDAAKAVEAFADGEVEPESSWEAVCAATQALAVPDTWRQHRETLAGHVARREWDSVTKAITGYFVSTSPLLAGPLERAPFEDCATNLRRAADLLDPYCNRAGLLWNPGRRARLMTRT